MSQPASGKKNCRFCQRSRWLMVLTMLVVMAGIVIINQPV